MKFEKKTKLKSEDEAEHDCGCETCAERGEELAAMKADKPGKGEKSEKGEPKTGGPGLMILIGGGEADSPRRQKLMEGLAKRKS